MAQLPSAPPRRLLSNYRFQLRCLLRCILFLVAGVLLATQVAAQSADVSTDGTVEVGGRKIEYRAVAGTITVHPKGWDDTARSDGTKRSPGEHDDGEAAASIFYAAYFQKGADPGERPITFIYNGGPGSSTMWLHMAGFGPKRVVTRASGHTAAPYRLTNNNYSLLDASDLVFIDAPGTGFSRVWGRNKEKAFYGLDADAHAFAVFINSFLTHSGRWSSPRYLMGESYGTTRSAILVNMLQNEYNVDFNGVIMLSQILNSDLDSKTPQYNPGTDQAYITTLPTYAAVAWHFNRLPDPRPASLEGLLDEVEKFATTEYAVALQAGSALPPDRRAAIAHRISQFTGIPDSYVLASDLRIDSGQFRKQILQDQGVTLGMCDASFTGASIDPLAKEADPQILPDLAATLSAYVAAVNEHVRKNLRFGGDVDYKPTADADSFWDWTRVQPPNAPTWVFGIANVMPDLATAMKANPDLKILVVGGYFDFCATYYASRYEMQHLPIPANLQKNIEYRYYETGHWPYIYDPALEKMHADVAGFIRRARGAAYPQKP